MRIATLLLCALDAAIAGAILFALFSGIPDPATSSLDSLAGYAVLALLLVTSVPAFVLSQRGHAPKTALALAAAFPVLLVMLVIAAALLI